jgi:hypothetical protein
MALPSAASSEAPERGIGTVVMVNATAFDVRGLLDAVDAAFLS